MSLAVRMSETGHTRQTLHNTAGQPQVIYKCKLQQDVRIGKHQQPLGTGTSRSGILRRAVLHHMRMASPWHSYRLSAWKNTPAPAEREAADATPLQAIAKACGRQKGGKRQMSGAVCAAPHLASVVALRVNQGL